MPYILTEGNLSRTEEVASISEHITLFRAPEIYVAVFGHAYTTGFCIACVDGNMSMINVAKLFSLDTVRAYDPNCNNKATRITRVLQEAHEAGCTEVVLAFVDTTLYCNKQSAFESLFAEILWTKTR